MLSVSCDGEGAFASVVGGWHLPTHLIVPRVPSNLLVPITHLLNTLNVSYYFIIISVVGSGC